MTLAMAKTDREILEFMVIEELKRDSHVDETDVAVEVNNGLVRLTGTVSSYAQKIAAQDAARRVMGVLDVANEIQVSVPGGQARTDMEIEQALRRAL